MDGGDIIDVILDRLRDAWNETIRTVVYLITKRVTKEVTEVLESDYWKILTITKKLITRFTYETSIDEFYESGKKKWVDSREWFIAIRMPNYAIILKRESDRCCFLLRLPVPPWEFLNIIVSPSHQPLIEIVTHNFASFNKRCNGREKSTGLKLHV